MKTFLHTLLCSTLAGALAPVVWAEELPIVPMEAKAAIVILPHAIEEPAARVQPRLRDSLHSVDHGGADQDRAYPYRLSVDERKRMREQLRGQAPVYRVNPQ